MSELDRKFHLVYTKVAGQKAGECKECMGSKCAEFDECCYQKDNDDMCYSDEAACDDFKPCPTCAPLRELAESEWDKPIEGKLFKFTKGINPTYTIQTIKATLEKLGEWEGFINWHDEQCATIIFQDDYSDYSECFDFGCLIDILAHADILTTDSLMLEAACAYLEAK